MDILAGLLTAIAFVLVMIWVSVSDINKRLKNHFPTAKEQYREIDV